MTKAPFFLASSSPRRLDLLHSIGLIADGIDPADIDETPKPRELPRQLAERLAGEKLRAVMARHSGCFVLAADTVVAVGRRILPKAETRADVEKCLRLLSGRRHRVITAVALADPHSTIVRRSAESVVAFRQLSPSEISFYLDSSEGIGKAGGYAVQGIAAAFIRFLSGSHSNIVGLPLFETAQLLKGCGYPLFEP